MRIDSWSFSKSNLTTMFDKVLCRIQARSRVNKLFYKLFLKPFSEHQGSQPVVLDPWSNIYSSDTKKNVVINHGRVRARMCNEELIEYF